MKVITLILAVAISALLTAFNYAQDKSHPLRKEEEPSTAIKELQKMRIAVLKELADTSLKLSQAARLDFGTALDDRINLLNAESDAAETIRERISIYERILNELTEYEQSARARKEAARGNELAMLRIKARSLEVRILLEQAALKDAE